jgi:LmbE family N-acetylglucosaminyl deacetylase
MEIPSATDWGFSGADSDSFKPNTFVEVGDMLDLKLEALACYRNVMRDYPHSRSVEALRGLAAMRGAQAGLDRAEAFQTVFRTSLG